MLFTRTTDKLKIAILFNGILIAYLINYLFFSNLIISSTLSNLIAFILPGVAWLKIVNPRKMRIDSISEILLIFVISFSFSVAGLLVIKLMNKPGDILFFFFWEVLAVNLGIITNKSLVSRNTSKSLGFIVFVIILSFLVRTSFFRR